MQDNLEEIEKIFGKEYSDALREVLRVREERLVQYGNTYLDDDYMFLYYQVLNKMKRFSLQLDKIENEEIIKNESVALDSAVDCVNYGLFIISKILKRKK